MRLIDADALKETMIEVLERIKSNPKMDKEEMHIIAGMSMLGEMIDDSPTVNRWIPVTERLPGPHEYVLLSFKNFTFPMLGRWDYDEEGNGAFYPGDEDRSLVSYDLYVNAWMPLPEPYREVER